MTLVEDRDRWAALVGAAQRGDASAWPELIDRFEDIAVASAVGLCGDLDEAPDIAQEAFVLAFRHIDGLQDPAAFPAWLLRLVRTATNRRTRRRRPATVPLDAVSRDDGPGALVDPAPGPEEVVLAAVEAAEVRAAVERLPEGERCVVALHHLAGMPYAEVAAFLGITVPAAKKRAWSARTRLKELLPMVADALAAARPSGTESFRDTILLFQALRAQDADGLARLLARNPSLATATEDWSPVEGFESRLGFSDRATALIRAAGIGDLRLVRLLVEAGAPVADACPCANHESALCGGGQHRRRRCRRLPARPRRLRRRRGVRRGGHRPPRRRVPRAARSRAPAAGGRGRPGRDRRARTHRRGLGCPESRPPVRGARRRCPVDPDPGHRLVRAAAARGAGAHPARLRARRDRRHARHGRRSHARALVDDRVRARTLRAGGVAAGRATSAA